MKVYSKIVLVYWIIALGLCPAIMLKADDLDETAAPPKTHSLDAPRVAVERSTEALGCFERAKSKGTVWLRTQGLADELMALVEPTHEPVNNAEVLSLSDKIVEHCRLIENQHALERARYLLTTIEKGRFDEDSVEAVRDMLIAADGPAALQLIEGLIESESAESR